MTKAKGNRTQQGDSTRSVHGGREKSHGPIPPPIIQSSTFSFPDHAQMLESFEAYDSGMVYTRYNNPTLEACETRIAELERAEAAWVFASGMAAITSAILSQVRAGERILAQREVYGGTHQFLTSYAPRLGIEVDWFNISSAEELEAGLAKRPQLVYLETPTNPALRCIDLAATAAKCRAIGATTIVDNTFATPLNQRPVELGIDMAVHSATKYLAGHSDLIAGAVAGSEEKLRDVWTARKLFGGVMDPQAAYLLERSMRTLAVRMKKHNENGMEIAQFLAEQPQIETVYYPGLETHADHEIAKRQMSRFGGMVTVTLRSDLQGTIQFVEALEMFQLAASLGGAESLVSIPATCSHFALTPEQRAAAGVPDAMVRLSLGIEDAEDLKKDLKQALAKVPTLKMSGAGTGS